MSNAAKAFLTGFMGEAAKQIKDENERLENYALTRANQLIKEMDEFDEEKKQLTNELKQQARDLSTYIASANPELTRAQVEQRVSGILLKGQGKRVVSMFEDAQKSGKITKQMADVFKPANDIADQGEDVVQETIRKMTTGVTLPGRGAGVMPTRGAYGLPTTAYTNVMQQAAATRGVSLDKFGAKRLPTIEEVGAPSDARLDLSVFAEEKEKDAPDVKKLRNKLVDDAIDAGMSIEDYIKTEEGSKLAARIAGRRLIGAGDEEEKARTTSQIRSLITDNIRERLTSLELNKHVYFSESLGDYAVKTPGSAEAKEYASLRANIVKDVFTNAGLLSGNRLTDRNAADAISAFANVDYNTLTIKGWRTPPAGAPAAPAPGTTSTQAEVKAEGSLFYVIEPGSQGRMGPFKSKQEALNARDAYNKQKTK